MARTIIRSGLILAISMLVAGSCTAATKYVIIVDLSKSAKLVFPQYRNAVHQILSQTPINIGDSVTVMGITDDSFGHSIILLQDSIKTRLRPKEPKLQDCSKLGKESFQYKSCVSTNTKTREKW